MRLSFLFLFGAVCLAASQETYDGYKVFRMWPKTDQQREFLRELEISEQYDFWADVKSINLPTDVMVQPEDQEAFVRMMKKAGMEPEVFVEDVQKNIEAENVGNFARAGMTFTAYYSLNDIYSWFDELAAAYPNIVTIQIGGSTYEGRQIKGVKISFGSGRKSVFLEGGIHAREWIAPATLNYITNELLTSTNAAFRKVADSFDWYIFPVVNPDGYVFSHTNTRLWRKTRTVYAGTCRGADPNRNWDAHWMEQGTSNVCSSDTYGGPSAFSETCTRTLSNYIRGMASNMVAYIDFHSYSQLLMVPYGHTTDRLDNYAETVAIGRKAAQALAGRYGTSYAVGNIAETIYRASGGSIDWVKQEFKTPLVYVYELRDTGRYGFILPADQIIPNSLEIIDSLLAMFNEAAAMGIVTLL